MQFIDEVKINVKSGDGGPGCVSFRREKYVEYGGPDGGDGGRGGSIIVQSVPGLNTLIDYRYKQHFKARNGEHGKGKQRNGAAAKDVILEVPEGTQILAEDGETLIADMTKVGEKLILAKGGDGGLGNMHFKSSVNQAPRKATPGWPGEEQWVWFKLKLLSDAGLVGLPNAGKSTFLSRVSRAKPKIADYPFTTLKPQLGVVYVHEDEFVLADIPGLIEGAHHGVGLGHRFLKHIERCGVLLHLIDATDEKVEENYKTIRTELEEYSDLLMEKQEVIALNKCDALTKEEREVKLKKLKKVTGKEVYPISAVSGEGVDKILELMYDHIETFRNPIEEE